MIKQIIICALVDIISLFALYMSLHMNQVVLFQPDEQLATYKTNDRFKTLENKINYNMLHIK